MRFEMDSAAHKKSVIVFDFKFEFEFNFILFDFSAVKTAPI